MQARLERSKWGHMGYLVLTNAVLWMKSKELPYTTWWKVEQDAVLEVYAPNDFSCFVEDCADPAHSPTL